MSEFDEYKFVEGMINDIIEASARQAITGYRKLLIDKLMTVRDEVFEGETALYGEKDPYKSGQMDVIEYVLSILREEIRIKDD